MLRRWLAVGLLLVSCTGVRAETAASVRANADRLIVEGDDETVVLDAESGAKVRSLSGGVLSPAKDVIVHVVPNGTSCGDPKAMQPCTLVVARDLEDRQLMDWYLMGDYRLPTAYGAAPSGFSPNGRWLVLVSRDAALSRFAILDLTDLPRRSSAAGPGLAAPAAKGAHTIVALDARFSFDAIHDDGSALYLIENPVPGSTAYNVRLYEVSSKLLRPEPIFDKATIATFDPARGLMDGAFHASVTPRGGAWSYGLYVKPDGRPFVHALNVGGRYATCILDVAGKRARSSMFSLALSPDARRLYVTDPATGTVTQIDATEQKVRRSATFAPRGGSADPRAATAAVSPDGGRLYATAATGIAALSTGDLALRSWIGADAPYRSIALSADGARVYALTSGAVHVIEAASGRVTAELAVPAGARAIHLLPKR